MMSVIHSTLCPNALRAHVGEQYAIGSVEECRLLKRGWNDTYLIRASGDRFILRVYSTARTPEEIRYELGLLMHLESSGIAVSTPVKSRSGNLTDTLQAPEGIREAAIFTFANGDVPKFGDLAEMHRFGTFAGKMHAEGERFLGPRRLGLADLLEKPAEAVLPHLEKRPRDAAFVAGLVESLARRLEGMDSLDVGPCHGDLHTGNLRSCEGRLRLFDFDFCGHGPREYDVASFASIAFMKRARDPLRAFLTGYSETRPRLDFAAVPLFMIVRFIWLVGTRIDRNAEAGEAWIGDYMDTWLATLRRLAPVIDAPAADSIDDVVSLIEERTLFNRLKNRLRQAV